MAGMNRRQKFVGKVLRREEVPAVFFRPCLQPLYDMLKLQGTGLAFPPVSSAPASDQRERLFVLGSFFYPASFSGAETCGRKGV
jgi:hypothetical protein